MLFAYDSCVMHRWMADAAGRWRSVCVCVCGGGWDCREWISVSAVVLAARGSKSRATESLYSGVFLIVIYCFVKYVFY